MLISASAWTYQFSQVSSCLIWQLWFFQHPIRNTAKYFVKSILLVWVENTWQSQLGCNRSQAWNPDRTTWVGEGK
jgi:hypothetical protein